MAWTWKAWHDLSSERPWIAGGMGPMMPSETPYRAALIWAERRGLCGTMTDFLLDALKVIDMEFFTAHSAKVKAAG